MELEDRFYCGDCREVLRQAPDACVDFILTDPPYLIDYSSRDGRRLEGDDFTGEWLGPAFQEMHRVLKDNRFCISFYGWTRADVFMQAWRSAGFRPVGHFVFIKRYNSSNKERLLKYHHEQAYLLVKGKPYQPNFPIKDVIVFDYTGNTYHPTEKPLRPLRKLIGAFTQIGDLVLDPLAGSGSALLAAWQMERKFLGCEKNPEYYELTRQRLASEIASGQRGITQRLSWPQANFQTTT